jgi:hypothetical protein
MTAARNAQGKGRQSVWSSRTQKGGATSEGRVDAGVRAAKKNLQVVPRTEAEIVKSCSFPSPRQRREQGGQAGFVRKGSDEKSSIQPR